MASQANSQPNIWSGEPASYPVVTVGPVRKRAPMERITWWKRIKTEERIGSLIASGGLVWAAQALTVDVHNTSSLIQTPGPIEVCAIGILIWMHAKWRRSVQI
ncbi:MAG TPA: hypothetical protein VKW78_17825 [Terriglobales bacterium]|nr:hypothetical protein [Terriglobales bacterium]